MQNQNKNTENTGKVAIFGAKGYIGRHLVQWFHAHDIPVEQFDIQADDSVKAADVTTQSFWDNFDAQNYDIIYFLCGLSGPEQSFLEADRYLTANELGLLLLLKRLSALGKKAPKIIFPSSRLVYQNGDNVLETSPLAPCSVYAVNKIACEAYLQAYYQRFEIPYAVLRICVPFGNTSGTGFSYGTMGIFTSQAMEKGKITVFGDGQIFKTYTHIQDICEIMFKIGYSDQVGVYNVGGHEYTLNQIADYIAEKYGVERVNVPWPPDAKRIDMGSIRLNADKLAHAINFNTYKEIGNL